MIHPYAYQKSIRALGLSHLGMFGETSMVFEMYLIKIKPDISVQ